MYFDDLLTDYLGEFGKYQIFLYLLISCIEIPAAYNTMGIVFVTAVPDHWCEVPALTNITTHLTMEQFKNLTAPPDESCKMYNHSYHTWTEDDINYYLDNGAPDSPEVNCMYGMAYSDEIYKSTITTEWDLVCDRDVVRATTSSVYMAGFMVGVIVTGNLSDVLGRRPVFILCLIGLIASSVAVSFSPSVIVFCILRFLTGFFNIGLFTTSFVIIMEVIGIKYRMHAGIAYQYFWAGGYLIYTIFAYYIRDWRMLYLVTSASCACLFVLPFILPESPRWLYAKQRKDKADKIVRKIAKWNNRKLPETLEIIVKSEEKGYMWDLFKTPRLRMRTFNVMFNWFVNSFVYYGLSLSSSSLAGNDYVNFALGAGVEIPAYIATQLALAFVGRRWPLALTMIIGGVSLLAIIPIPDDMAWLATTLAMIGKFFISASFAIIYVVSAEVYPTVIRQVGVATGSFCARVGGLVAPYVGLLDKHGSWVPMVIFGSTSVLAGLLALAFPETKDKKLPETLEEGEKFGLEDLKGYESEKGVKSIEETGKAWDGMQGGKDNRGFTEEIGVRL